MKYAILSLIAFISCHAPADYQSPLRYIVENDETILADRAEEKDEEIPIDTTVVQEKRYKYSPPKKKFTLTLVKEIYPPQVSGVTVQATSVKIKGDFAYISYNVKGATFYGAVDVVQIKGGKNAVIKSSVLFLTRDISAIDFDNNYVYLAQGADDGTTENPAMIEEIRSNGGKLQLDEIQNKSLTGHVATSVAIDGNELYITTGANGGLYHFDQKEFVQKNFIPITDARWVEYDNAYVAVLRGTPGELFLYGSKDLSLVRSIPFNGANIAESKSQFELVGDKAVIGAGDGGVKLYDLADGALITEIDREIINGLDPSVTVTNAVSADADHLYISNGEAGVYVAEASDNMNNKNNKNITFNLLGKLQFQSLESVNHVAFKGKWLIVASGLGGVKIVEVKFK